MIKNTAGQKLAVYAHDTIADEPKTGDAANITAYFSKDGAEEVVSDDTNPTELDATNMKGIYLFTLTQDETNCDLFVACAESSTAGVLLDPVILTTREVMVGTDSAALASVCTEARLAELDAANLPTDIAAVQTTATAIDDLIKADGDGDLKFIKDVLEGDAEIDTGQTPWELVIKIKDTDTELIRKALKDVSGGNVTATTTIVGTQEEPA